MRIAEIARLVIAMLLAVFICGVLSSSKPTIIRGVAVDAQGQPGRFVVVAFLDGEEIARDQSTLEIQTDVAYPDDRYNYTLSVPVDVAVRSHQRGHIGVSVDTDLQPNESWSRRTRDNEHLLVIKNLGDPATAPTPSANSPSSGEMPIVSRPKSFFQTPVGMITTTALVTSLILVLAYTAFNRWQKAASDVRPRVTIPSKAEKESHQKLSELRQILIERFSESELRTLCFELNLDYDDLRGEAKTDKARELVSYFERRKQVSDLVDAGRRLRPDIFW